MPGWRPLPRIAFAICVYPFQPSSPADLPLEIGDELYIIEQGGKDGSWYRGYLVAPPSLLAGLTSVQGQTLEARVFSGIFPRCCVEVREVLGEGKQNSATISDLAEKPPSSSRGSHGEPPSNGVLTPIERTSATSAKTVAAYSKSSSRIDQTTARSSISPRPLSAHRLSQRRAGSHGSQWSSNNIQQFMLPLSPISVSPRDPNAPRPPAPVPMLKIGDETPTSAQEPLVDEIASCLREWHSTKLHELLLARRYSSLDKMSALVHRLDTARRQLLHKVLTAQELHRVRELTVWDLVSGNKMLSGDVIVRSPSERGRILTSEDSAIEITKLQSIMSLLEKKPLQSVEEHTFHHLFVNLKGKFGNLGQASAHISMYLCLWIPGPGSLPKPLSEVYTFELSSTSTPAADKMRALFVDLSSTDIGEGAGSGSSLFLVFKLYATESGKPASTVTSANSPRESTSSNPPSMQTSQFGSIKSGRRSAMFGSKQRKEGGQPNMGSEFRPTSMDSNRAQSQEGRPGSAAKGKLPSKDQKGLKRAVAFGSLRVDQLMKSRSESEQQVTLWSPITPDDEAAEESGETWDDILTKLCPTETKRYQKSPLVNRLSVSLKAFANPDANSLIERTPTLLHNITQARKIGFSGAPTKPRSDIYLTIVEPRLPEHAFLSHPKNGSVPLNTHSSMKNLQLTLEVRKSTGERIEGCIYPSCNSAGHTAWRTVATERGRSWNTTIRLALDPEDVPGSHIVMSVADAPGFPFALCWMPLWSQDAFIRDGEHFLALYKYDEYTSSMIAGKGAYLALPWRLKKKDEDVTGSLSALQLRTYLCSTKYSQDPNLLGLLKWRDQPAGELVSLLKRFVFVPEIEIVKLLPEVFDALFEILVEYAGSDEYEDLVFNSLVTVLGIVHDRRFNLAPLVDQYVETRFSYPFATSCLIRSYTRLLANPVDPESSRKLRATFKVGRHVLKFIMNARQQQKEKEAGIGITSRQPNFTKELQTIFKSLEALMKNPSAILIGTKTIVVQQFHSWLPELSSSMSPSEILSLASSFIDSCSTAQGKLLLYKLVLINHFNDLEIFKAPDIRKVLLSKTVHWLSPHWGNVTTVTEQWKDQVRLCCSVVASQVEELGEEACEYFPKLIESYRTIQESPRQAKNHLSLLFPSSYPFPSRPITSATAFDEALIEISAVLAAMSSLPSIIHLDWPKSDIADFLFSTLQVYISILDCEAFPSSWLSVHIYHHKATMRTLEKLSSILIDSFLPHPDEADQFNTELWRAFFDALLKLVGSDALALETFPEQKRRAVWKIAGDVRESGADLLRRSWEAIGWETSPEDKKQYGLEKMGGFQVQYVPGLVAPIVELCLSVHEGLRSVAIEVLQTMIVSEWTLSEDLSLIQAEMIDCLDRLFKSKHLTESILQKLFIGELIDLFEPLAQDADDPLFVAVKNLITTIDELLDLLVAVHNTEATGEVFHIMDTLHLMEFLKDMQKEEIYIRYVHQLVDLQANSQNYTEAGLALRLHAELYEWDPTIIVDPLREPAFPAQSSFDRKEQLYFQMIKYYEDGQSWDNALGTYMELATQYEHNVFDFAKLARTQHAMAAIYESIARGDRQNPRYFRVAYKGMGFPVGLRDKHFIFEASPTDRLATFTDRMQQQHPSAQILSPGGEEDVEGQYLQIYPVSAQKDLLHPIYQRAKVAQSIRDYYLLSRPSQFTSSSRRQTGENGIKDLTVEKTVYTTAEAFPTILRRSEIVSVGTVTLTSLQTAIERTSRKTVELLTLEKRVSDGEDSALTALTQELTMAVDPKSETSVAIYHDLLPQPRDSMASDEENGEETHQQPDQLQNALKVALLDYAMVIRRCLALFSRPAQQATKAELTQRFEITFARETATFMPAPQGHLMQSPTGSWMVSNTPSTLVTSATALPIIQANGTRVVSPPPDGRPARQDKNRLSMSLFKGTTPSEPQETRKNGNPVREEEVDTTSNDTSTRSRSKDASKHRLSWLNPSSTNESMPPPPAPPAQVPRPQAPTPQSSSYDKGPKSQGVARTDTSKSEKSEQHSLTSKKGSVRKRLSMLHIGKKSSKNSVKGRMEDTLVEE